MDRSTLISTPYQHKDRRRYNKRGNADMTAGNRPDFDVFAIREREDGEGKDIFVKIGVAFKRRNGEGMTIMLDALPFSRKLAVLAPRDEPDRS
jgi:hypothetical protein